MTLEVERILHQVRPRENLERTSVADGNAIGQVIVGDRLGRDITPRVQRRLEIHDQLVDVAMAWG